MMSLLLRDAVGISGTGEREKAVGLLKTLTKTRHLIGIKNKVDTAEDVQSAAAFCVRRGAGSLSGVNPKMAGSVRSAKPRQAKVPRCWYQQIRGAHHNGETSLRLARRRLSQRRYRTYRPDETLRCLLANTFPVLVAQQAPSFFSVRKRRLPPGNKARCHTECQQEG